MARNIVMGQSKGKNTEPVDIFKGLVCFNNINDDKDQDQVLKDWNSLADDEVGRSVLEEACVLVAQGRLGRLLRKDGEVDIFENYLEKVIVEKVKKNEGYDGKAFFRENVKPAAKMLRQFYDSNVDLKKKDETAPSL
eukprot:scaffold170055_cov36-Cyclotella_meneghiniana.AAC.1